MSELVEFIRGCLDADEQTARMEVEHPLAGPPSLGWVEYGPGHALTVDPARVLAEVNAKRAILDAVTSGWFDSDIEVVLPLLAQPFAGEPGWRDEWGTQ